MITQYQINLMQKITVKIHKLSLLLSSNMLCDKSVIIVKEKLSKLHKEASEIFIGEGNTLEDQIKFNEYLNMVTGNTTYSCNRKTARSILECHFKKHMIKELTCKNVSLTQTNVELDKQYKKLHGGNIFKKRKNRELFSMNEFDIRNTQLRIDNVQRDINDFNDSFRQELNVINEKTLTFISTELKVGYGDIRTKPKIEFEHQAKVCELSSKNDNGLLFKLEPVVDSTTNDACIQFNESKLSKKRRKVTNNYNRQVKSNGLTMIITQIELPHTIDELHRSLDI